MREYQIQFKNRILNFSSNDYKFILDKVRPAFEAMETHVEIFELPSGKNLWMYCDGTVKLVSDKGEG